MKTSKLTFEETVQEMSMKEIILAMVKGLRKPHIEINMDTFGAEDRGVCFGCAATNTICEMAGKTFDSFYIKTRFSRAEFVDCSVLFLQEFELAIDRLRRVRLDAYNLTVHSLGIAEMPPTHIILPELDTDYTQDQLDVWEDYANTL